MRKKIIIGLILVMFFIGCGSYERVGVTTYASLQITLEQTRITARKMCEEETIKESDCEEIAKEYNKAARALYEAGNVWDNIIASGSLVQADDYEELLKNAQKIVNSINDIVEEYGGKL